jgi:hypothetical protein
MILRGETEAGSAGTQPPNKRLKLPGGDRFKETGVLCLPGTDCRPISLRQRAGRPQLSAIR